MNEATILPLTLRSFLFYFLDKHGSIMGLGQEGPTACPELHPLA